MGSSRALKWPTRTNSNPKSDFKPKPGPKIRLDKKMHTVTARNETSHC